MNLLFQFEWFDRLWNQWYSLVPFYYTTSNLYSKMDSVGPHVDSFNFYIGAAWFIACLCIGAFVEKESWKYNIIGWWGIAGGTAVALAFPVIVIVVAYAALFFGLFMGFSILGKRYRKSVAEDKKAKERFEKLQGESRIW